MPYKTSVKTNTPDVMRAPRARKVCLFCETKTEPVYTDSITLRKFMSDRSKIVSKARTGACSKHQRRITKEIKHARHLALLPFVTKL